jgi:hypothetical protein
MQLQSLSGLKLMLSLNPRAGRPTSATLREAIAITFPAIRDTHQLRAVLGGIPLCEVHGTARTDLHLQGTLFTLMTSEVQAPLQGFKMPTPSPTGMQGVNSTGSSVHNPLDGPHDFETSPSQAQDSSRPSDPEPAAPPSARLPLSWLSEKIMSVTISTSSSSKKRISRARQRSMLMSRVEPRVGSRVGRRSRERFSVMV